MKKIYTILLLLCLDGLSVQAQWTTVCNTGNEMVVSFARYNNNIYATGFFTNICGTNANYIAQWDGTSWTAVDTGLSDAGHRVETLDDTLYVAQYRQTTDSNWVLRWNGSHFERIGEGVYLTGAVTGTSKTANLYDVIKYKNRLIASGEFNVVGNKAISGIMQWNGVEWDSLGSGLGGSLGSGVMYPHQMMVHDTSLYVIGSFLTAGGITVNGVARWDGTQWHAMGAGFNNDVYCINVINNEIYVGGEFILSGTTKLQRIAKWDGTQWVNPGFGVYYTNPSLHAYVHTLQQIGTHGVFEGGFDRMVTATDTVVANSIIAYDGVTADSLSGGIPGGEFEGLIDYDTTFLVGGALFTSTTTTTHIATYAFPAVSVRNVTKNSNIKIYPNPANDRLYIDNALGGDILSVYNTVGQELYKATLNTTHENVNMNIFLPGIYMLQIMHNDGSRSYQQVVKQ